ncbi:MAG TPA: hypothetical protein VF053_16355 [Streptosporangiales bacterium]
MIARGLVIGVALIAMGLLHVFGNGTWTAVIGAVLFTAAGVGWLVQRQRRAVAERNDGDAG